MGLIIRPYTGQDFSALYEICLKTGDSGGDASRLFNDPFLLGHFYAAPYAVFHPELTFILADNERPVGYIIGTDNSELFFDTTEREWFPPLREKYPPPDDNDGTADARIIRLIHKGHVPRTELLSYPAHLHIDILPEGQGRGMGRKLIETFISKLIDMNVNALHLEVGKRNINAIKFYEKTGFHIIREFDFSVAYGKKFRIR
ncbi:MAG: GNAT family N-acetyltransferase [Ignavibacteriae bacterium HGW-Ignavibacteriae-3]|nr:MAG: GNAT family N-acetyltransferase [Ignavibacteriae bacterium HGW-Ignavibacteriae-3]